MDNSWVKFYRKILRNDSLFRSKNTFIIWCWLLLMADRNTGIVTCGRFQISRWLKVKPSTVYLTLKRLQNMTMIKLKPDNKMTTITILNWHTYQDKHDNKMTTNQQLNDTKQEYRKKTSSSKEVEKKGVQGEKGGMNPPPPPLLSQEPEQVIEGFIKSKEKPEKHPFEEWMEDHPGWTFIK